MSQVTIEEFLDEAEADEIPWSRPSGAPVSLTPSRVLIADGVSALEVAVAEALTQPKVNDVRRLWAARWNRRAAPVVLVVGYQVDGTWKAAVCGSKDDPAVLLDLDLEQVERICAAALAAPDPTNAERTLHRLLIGQKDQLVAGLTNSGLFASHELRNGVPTRPDWASQKAKGARLLQHQGADLIRGLGYAVIPHGSSALILTVPGSRRAVAILLDEHEMFERPTTRFGAVSPVAYGLAIAQEQGLPWLLVTRGTQIRMYPARPDVGVGRKGQAETFVEVDLALLAEKDAAYLTLLFSADALAAEGSVPQILGASADHAAALGRRLRERVYVDVVPRLAVAVANRMGARSEADLSEAYHRTLLILFRLLFVAYAEDRGLLPYQRNPRYTRKALKTLAREFTETPDQHFDESSTDRWDDLLAVWRAVDDGNTEWGVPPYNGGLFASDDTHPSGQAVASMRLTNAEIGPALRALLVDTGEDGTLGPVDFRSLSVREFGTIYEGLLESSLSIAPVDLAVDSKTKAYVPATDDDDIVTPAGQIYFHNASGVRKATGSYFTKVFAVEHVLETALEPALQRHLNRVKRLLEAGDEGAATEAFFDFRIADLAMGSGHFLVAAIDRIENRLSAFLAANPIPAVAEELGRLSDAALTALGSSAPDIEIEPSALLRRQIARRCIYGLDLNTMAVELARLAIWIHTFVPGLPMSSLAHGLRRGSSLTGIGTVDEAFDIFEPHRANDQYSFFAEPIESALTAARDSLMRVARTAEATKQEVREAARAHKKAMTDAADAKALLDAAVGVRLGLINPPSTPEEAIQDGNSDSVQDAVTKFQIEHFPYLFPEVFLRENPGFDVLVGNPPWEKIRHESHQFWVIRDPGLRAVKGSKRTERIKWLRQTRPQDAAEEDRESAEREALKELLAKSYRWQKSQHYDFAKVFAERNMRLVRSGGSVGIVLPQALLMLGGWAPIRERMVRDHHLLAFPLLNRAEWVFTDVEARQPICLIALTPGQGCTVHAASDSLVRFRQEQRQPGVNLSLSDLADLSEQLNVPWFKQPEDPQIFTAMADYPHLGTGNGWVSATADSTRWDFSGSGKHKTHASESDSPGSWRVTMTRHVDPYQLTDDPEGKRVPRPGDLVNGRNGVALRDGRVMLDESHPPLVFRFFSKNDNSRTLIATALPESGWLYSKGYAHGVRLSAQVPTRDILALLGYLNSLPADWWARRFVDRHLGKRIIDGLPLPDWSIEQRDLVAGWVGSLLRSHGYSTLAGGRQLPTGEVAGAGADLRARIDALALQGLSLSAHEAETMFLDFEDTEDALPARQRERIMEYLSN
ncbi:Eco57I restriction-modification methylase domain-containing protein [Streptomyces sp. enrichment culture]|uniref:Eco57I restriction-modification methylase domain-containing protein n=1 Tax=Streptomyces sp. enrichment culture TaxID=1795815 RepID=UPI003F5604C9